MNLVHRRYCASQRWAALLDEQLLPWVLDGVALGPDVLELGPGPGLTTAALRQRCTRLTAIEVEPAAARALAARLPEVVVVPGDATRMPFQGASFSTVVCLTMLHHVPSPEAQDRLLAEVARVLRPGGQFVGLDSRTSARFRLIHLFDTLVPVDPTGLPARLQRAGLAEVAVEATARRFRFQARRPVGDTGRPPGVSGA